MCIVPSRKACCQQSNSTTSPPPLVVSCLGFLTPTRQVTLRGVLGPFGDQYRCPLFGHRPGVLIIPGPWEYSRGVGRLLPHPPDSFCWTPGGPFAPFLPLQVGASLGPFGAQKLVVFRFFYPHSVVAHDSLVGNGGLSDFQPKSYFPPCWKWKV